MRIIKFVVTFMAIYAALVSGIWGFVEAYTYFQGDYLKQLVGSYWIALYLLPLLPTLIVTYWRNRDKRSLAKNHFSNLREKNTHIIDEVEAEMIARKYIKDRYNRNSRPEPRLYLNHTRKIPAFAQIIDGRLAPKGYAFIFFANTDQMDLLTVYENGKCTNYKHYEHGKRTLDRAGANY